jgi:hypothetical protein
VESESSLCATPSRIGARFIVGTRVGRDGAVPIPAIVKRKPLWGGKQILSMVIPRDINIHRSPDPKSSNPVFDDDMMVENGEIIFGIVEKKSVGASQGGLVHAQSIPAKINIPTSINTHELRKNPISHPHHTRYA